MPKKSTCFKPYYKVECGICPCMDCKKRYVGCHSKCEDYIKWGNEHKEKREERQNKAYVQHQADYMYIDSVRKYKKKMRSKGRNV